MLRRVGLCKARTGTFYLLIKSPYLPQFIPLIYTYLFMTGWHGWTALLGVTCLWDATERQTSKHCTKGGDFMKNCMLFGPTFRHLPVATVHSVLTVSVSSRIGNRSLFHMFHFPRSQTMERCLP